MFLDCADAHQGELVSGLKHTIQVLNNTILSNLAGDKADFTQRSEQIFVFEVANCLGRQCNQVCEESR